MNEDDPLSPLIKSSYYSSTVAEGGGVEVPSHAVMFLKQLRTMRKHQNLCDTKLICHGEEFAVHRAVLAGGSLYFANYFDRWLPDPDKREVVLNSVDPTALSALLDFLYSGVLNVTTDNMFEIFAAADTLQVEAVQFVCMTQLHVHLNPESCVKTLNFAVLYSIYPLADAAITLICTEPMVYNSSDVLSDEAWNAIQGWLMKRKNHTVIIPHTVVYNLLQIRPGSSSAFSAIFPDMEERTRQLLTSSVIPTAASILCAARAHASSSPCPSPSGPEQSCPPVLEPATEPVAEEEEEDRARVVSVSPSDTLTITSRADPTPPSNSVATPSSRLWTITCNHPGLEEPVTKRRKVAAPTAQPVNQWRTKMVLLGGSNSTMSTVRTIFRHIQPFSVVTGVTVVKSNLSLDLDSCKTNSVYQDWEDSGELAQPCFGCAATTAGTNAYVFGGKDQSSQFLAEMQQFDLKTDQCRLMEPGPRPRENAVAVRIGDDIYIVGGRNNTIAEQCQYVVDKYSISGNSWTTVAPCFKIGYQGAAAACNGLLFTFCGQRPHGKPTDTVMCYEPHANSWSPQPNVPSTMGSCQAATSNRKIFLLTAEYKSVVLYHFQPDQRLWTRVLGSILNEPQNFFIMNSAVASHNGSLYILLFMCEEVVRVVRVQRFDTATGTWEIVSTKPIPVQNSAMLLTSYYIKAALGEGAAAAVE